MSWNVGTVRDPDGLVHIWYLCTLGSIEDDVVVCGGGDRPRFIPIENVNREGGWRYCMARVTCPRCMGDDR